MKGITSSLMESTLHAAKCSSRNIELDPWTGKEKMIPKSFKRLCIQPTTLIDRPNPTNLTNPNFHLVIDTEEIDYTVPSIPPLPINSR